MMNRTNKYESSKDAEVSPDLSVYFITEGIKSHRATEHHTQEEVVTTCRYCLAFDHLLQTNPQRTDIVGTGYSFKCYDLNDSYSYSLNSIRSFVYTYKSFYDIIIVMYTGFETGTISEFLSNHFGSRNMSKEF